MSPNPAIDVPTPVGTEATGLVMGVLNVTPDSFSDGGRYLDPQAAVDHGRRMLAEGAAIIDVGGESTRPGADPVDEAEEIRRVVPVIEALAEVGRVSIDTSKPGVARAAMAAGASLVNDVTSTLAEVAAEGGAGWVAMHMQGTPRTMQDAPHYDDVVGEVVDFLAARADAAAALGIAEIWIDPGIGFGKTHQDNLMLLRHLEQVVAVGHPVLIGTSRKRFLGQILTDSDSSASRSSTTPVPFVGPDDRFEASVATAAWALTQGARMVRAHDVLGTVQAARVVGP